jgi:hypothetical protein
MSTANSAHHGAHSAGPTKHRKRTDVAALNSVHIDCPACGETINIPLQAVCGEPDGNTVPITLTPDLTPITAHAAQHREEP